MGALSNLRALARGPRPEGRLRLRARIVATYPLGARLYATIRFAILRTNILSVLDVLLPEEGRILDVGCGFGLLAGYFAAQSPRRRVTGIDREAGRIAHAARMAEALGLPASFVVGDATDLPAGEVFDAAYAVDLLHHVPAAEHADVLRRLRARLVPGGLLLVKEIGTQPFPKLAFTWALDRVMAPRDALSYRRPEDWAALLAEAGFEVRVRELDDVLPYPHVLLVCRRVERPAPALAPGPQRGSPDGAGQTE